ncbi:MAG: phytanoyl-CoA dioxygenase family protein [Albidovulum sp.]|nr:phytanoyl-CoA dioxygenase family protein [Albidovulum sp.]MDE0305572.1 phytanoyl-CoA dioxygenase family protein [Albidovulum sp.]MDE0534442.1 phytanoyl-CoA dioxygenase family protein [Albidovulum sp.]
MKRLGVGEMTCFVRDGFLKLEGLVPTDLCDAFRAAYVKDCKDDRCGRALLPVVPWSTPLAGAFGGSEVLSRVFALPELSGAIYSLLGPRCRVDHHVMHIREPNQGKSQHLHCDAMIDARDDAFDIQVMIYPQDVTREMGGTLVIPGSHTRKAGETSIARYQNLAGQVQLTGPAGTILILHHNLWHAGRRNASNSVRAMYKIRLNPTGSQTGHWDMSDYDAAKARGPKPLHSPATDKQDVQGQLSCFHPWADIRSAHLDIIQRTRLWRLLTGDEEFSVHHFLSRLENEPT